jgi:hypothetical protein
VAHGKLAKNEVQKNLMTNQHAYPIAPVAQGKIPRNRVQKNSTNNEQASPKKVRISFHLCCNLYAFKQNIHTPKQVSTLKCISLLVSQL